VARRITDVAPLVRPETQAEEERKTSYLELFFDLVFVFAFTQVTALILEDTSPQGFLRSALVLAMVWWAWSAYTWMTNAIDIENTITRLILFAAMAAGFFMALAVPAAPSHFAERFALIVTSRWASLMRFRVIRRIAWARLAAAAAVLAIAVALDGADAIVTLGVVIVVLAFAVAIETARLRELRAELRAG